MPLYDFRCQVCGKHVEHYFGMNDKKELWCCEMPVKRLYTHNVPADLLYPYVSHNIGPEPIEVRSRTHKRQLLRENNLSDDVAWSGRDSYPRKKTYFVM